MPARRAWRIRVTANNGDASHSSVAEIQLRGSAGGADLVPTQTGDVGSPIIASSFHNDSFSGPRRAFDDTTTSEAVSQSGAAVGWWIGYDGGANPLNWLDVQEVAIMRQDEGGVGGLGHQRAPKDFVIEYTDDDPAGTPTWSVTDTYLNETTWPLNTFNTYAVTNVAPSPDQPSILSATQARVLKDGYLKTVDVTLTGSAYSGPGTMTDAEWEITDDGAPYVLTSVDETLDIFAMRVALANSVRVRYRSSFATWSDWSDPFSLTTLAWPPEATFRGIPGTTNRMRIFGTTWGTVNPHRVYAAPLSAGMTSTNFASVGTQVWEGSLTYNDPTSPIFDFFDVVVANRDNLCFVLAGFDPGEGLSGAYIAGAPFCFPTSTPGYYSCFDFASARMESFWLPEYGDAPIGPQGDCVGACIFSAVPTNPNPASRYYSDFPAVWALTRAVDGSPLPGASSQRMSASAKPGTGARDWFAPTAGAKFSYYGVGALISAAPGGRAYGFFAMLGTGELWDFGCCCDWGLATGLRQTLDVWVFAPGATHNYNVALPEIDLVRTARHCGGEPFGCVCKCETNPPSSGAPLSMSVAFLGPNAGGGYDYAFTARLATTTITDVITLPVPMPCGFPGFITKTNGASTFWANPEAVDLSYDGCVTAALPACTPSIPTPDVTVSVDCADVDVLSLYAHTCAGNFAEMDVEIEESDGMGGWTARPDLSATVTTLLHAITGHEDGDFRARIRHRDDLTPTPTESAWSDWAEYTVAVGLSAPTLVLGTPIYSGATVTIPWTSNGEMFQIEFRRSTSAPWEIIGMADASAASFAFDPPPNTCGFLRITARSDCLDTTVLLDLYPPCALLLEVYEDDRVTVAWTATTNPCGENRYLCLPENYGEQEIDIIAGAATIGQVEVAVIDRRIIEGDQDSGWMTDKIADGITGRRCRLRRFTPTGWVTIADGPAAEPYLDDSYAAYKWMIRDTRETERKIRAFVNGGTSTVFPLGVLSGFGDLGGGTFLVDPTTPLTGTYDEIYARGGWINVQSYWTNIGSSIVPQSMVLTDAILKAIEPNVSLRAYQSPILDGFGFPTGEFETLYAGTYSFPNLIGLWRPAGTTDPWTRLNMRGTVEDPVVALTVAISKANATLDSLSGPAVIAATHVALQDDGTAPMPANGQSIDFLLLYAGEPSEDFPFHIEGITVGELIQNGFDGVYSELDASDNPIPTGVRYDPARLALMTDPVTMRVTEPVDDFRAWSEEFAFAPDGWVPALDNDGQVSPMSDEEPTDLSLLLDLSNVMTEPAPDWNAGAIVINTLEFTYPRLWPAPDSTAADGLAVRDVVVRYIDPVSVERHGEQLKEYDLSIFAALGDSVGAPVTTPEFAATVALQRRTRLFTRFANGAQAFSARIMRSVSADLRAGEWVKGNLSWFPDYLSRRRGQVDLVAQVIAIRDDDCAWRHPLFEVGGGSGS